MKRHFDWVAIHQAQKVLATLYPELFSLLNPVPLKIGIKDDILVRFPGIRRHVLGGLLGWLTHRRDYLERCTEGATRYGFDGPDGVVTAAEAEFALKKFVEREISSLPRVKAA